MTPTELRALITRALPDSHTVDDVLGGIELGEFQLWPGESSVIVTQLQTQPRTKLLCLFLAAGTLDELHQMLPGILDWGKSQGCERAFLNGRAGWTRSFLQHEGWTQTSVVMELELTGVTA